MSPAAPADPAKNKLKNWKNNIIIIINKAWGYIFYIHFGLFLNITIIFGGSGGSRGRQKLKLLFFLNFRLNFRGSRGRNGRQIKEMLIFYLSYYKI